MKNFDEFSNSQEYKLWGVLYKYAEDHDWRQSDVVSKNDVTEFWEPFLELLFKLAITYKQTGKIKEVKVKWMRPIFFFGDNTKKVFDKKEYEPPKESLDAAQEITRRLRNLCEVIERYPKLDNSTWKGYRKEFQKNSGDLWKCIIKFATKVGFKELNQIIKWILAPLLYLRKAAVNLLRLECRQQGISDFVMLNNKPDVITFVNHIRDNYKKHEEDRLKRDMGDDLDS